MVGIRKIFFASKKQETEKSLNIYDQEKYGKKVAHTIEAYTFEEKFWKQTKIYYSKKYQNSTNGADKLQITSQSGAEPPERGQKSEKINKMLVENLKSTKN